MRNILGEREFCGTCTLKGALAPVVSHPDPQTTGHFRREYSTGDVVFR
jgi:hypothetical protein